MKTCTKCLQAFARDHFTVRRASPDGLSLICKSCAATAKRAAYIADPQRAKDRATRWAANNRERRREIANSSKRRIAAQRAATAPTRRMISAQNNPLGLKITTAVSNHNRIASKAGAPKVDRRAVAIVFNVARGRCTYCDQERVLTLDHVTPRRDGGTNAWDNLVACCLSCNAAKSAHCVADYVYSKHGVHGLVRTLFALKNIRKCIKKLHPDLLACEGIEIKEVA